MGERNLLQAESPAFVERIAAQIARRQTLATEIESIERQLMISRERITPEMITAFERVLRQQSVSGDPNFRRSYAA